MKKGIMYSLSGVVVFMAISPVQAADIGSGFDLSGNMAIASNYIWRGQTQTGNEEAIQGGLDLAHESGLYLGTWGSNLSSGTEFDYYGGYATELAGVGFDLGVIAYRYPQSSSSNFEESYLGISKTLGPIDTGVTFYSGHDSSPDAWELTFGAEIAGFGVSTGYTDYDSTSSTNYGETVSFGVSREVLSESWPVELGLVYTDFDSDGGSSSDEDDLTFTIAKSF